METRNHEHFEVFKANTSFQNWDHFFPLLFPKDSESLKIFGHPTSGSGGKKTFKRYHKYLDLIDLIIND